MIGLDEIHVPKLRQDIQLLEGPTEPDGAPTWTLHDPSANKFYKIGWLEFECLVRFGKCRTAKELLASVARETTLRADEDTIKHLINFLMAHNLLRANDPGMLAYLEKENERRRQPLWKRILHGYLYFTIPLFRPQRFLEKTFPYIRFLFSGNFFSVMLALLGYGIFLTLQRWDEFLHTFMSYLDLEGIALMVITTIFVKIIHEMSHAYTATKYGVPVPTIGVALMVLYPVLYTETTSIWRLSSRTQRMHIAAAGVMGETVLASIALILWHILPPGLGQSVAFIVAAVSMLASLIMNLNPLMRFDGYYLFSDLTGFDNLQDRSFNFAKWRLRRILWGWNDPPPETLVPERQHFLEIFGFSTLIYRFFLFLGIAVMVYYLFPKPLGLVLMLIEILFFIALPIWKEMLIWKEGFGKISSSMHGKLAFFVGFLLILSLFVPWQHSIAVPAMLHAQTYKNLYPPVPARIEKIAVNASKTVTSGEALFILSSPELDYDIDIAHQKLTLAENVRDREQASRELSNKRLTIQQEIDTVKKQLEGLLEQRELLTVRADFSGKIRDMNPYLHEGLWVNPSEQLALLIEPEKNILTGYVREQDIARVRENTQGYFYPETDLTKRYPVTVSQIEKTDTNNIFWQELSSVYGGPIPADSGPNRQPIARYTLYSVKFALETVNEITPPGLATRGVIRLEADPTSPAKSLIKHTISLFLRESGL